MTLDIRSRGFALTPGLRARVERRVAFALDRHQDRVERIVVRLADVNGPRGGADKRCTVQLRVRGRGTLRVEHTDSDLYRAIDQAIHRAAHALGRNVRRERRLLLELLALASAASGR